MRAYTETITFDASAAQASAKPAGNRITGLIVEPAAANTHVCYVSLNSGAATLDITASPPAGVTRRIAAPTATGVNDRFEYHIQDATSRLLVGDVRFGGTSGEKAYVTWFEA